MKGVLGLGLFCLSTAVATQTEPQPPLMIIGDAIVLPLSAVPASAEQGEQVFVSRDGGHCVLCHRVSGLTAPFQGNMGPALDDIGDRLSPEQIRLRIADASVLNAQTIMQPFYRIHDLHRVEEKYQRRTALSGVQIEHLVAYLAQLRSDAG